MPRPLHVHHCRRAAHTDVLSLCTLNQLGCVAHGNAVCVRPQVGSAMDGLAASVANIYTPQGLCTLQVHSVVKLVSPGHAAFGGGGRGGGRRGGQGRGRGRGGAAQAANHSEVAVKVNLLAEAITSPLPSPPHSNQQQQQQQQQAVQPAGTRPSRSQLAQVSWQLLTSFHKTTTGDPLPVPLCSATRAVGGGPQQPPVTQLPMHVGTAVTGTGLATTVEGAPSTASSSGDTTAAFVPAAVTQMLTASSAANEDAAAATAAQQEVEEAEAQWLHVLEDAKQANLARVNDMLKRGKACDVVVRPEMVWRSSMGAGLKLTAMHVLLH